MCRLNVQFCRRLGGDGDAARDAVEITLPRGGDATTLGTLFHNTNSLELLKDSASDGTGTDGVVEAADAVVTGTAVVLAEGTHTHVAGHVELASHGRRADVEPVGVVGRELLVGGSLHDVDPGGDLHLRIEGNA